MANPHIRLLFYAIAVSGACVEILGSTEVGVWHPSLYWAAVAGIIPCGLIGILRIKQLHAGPGYELQAGDLPKPIATTAFFTVVPAKMSGDLRLGPTGAAHARQPAPVGADTAVACKRRG